MVSAFPHGQQIFRRGMFGNARTAAARILRFDPENFVRFYARNGRYAAVEDWGELVAGDPLHRKTVTGYHTPDAP
jgi:hypothetical protein